MNSLRTLIAVSLALSCSLAGAEDKVLRLYNWADYFAEDTLKDFTAQTGIKVIYDVMDSSETLEAKLLSGNSGYDLIFPSDTVAERLARAGALQKLDPGKLEYLADIEPGLRRLHQRYPNSRESTVPYTWGSIGLTYNRAAIEQRIANAPVNSLDLLFKPENAARLADCGISMIDSPDEVLAVALHYLGKDPRSGKADDLLAARQMLGAIKPYIRKFQSQPVKRSSSATTSRWRARPSGWTAWPSPPTPPTRNTPTLLSTSSCSRSRWRLSVRSPATPPPAPRHGRWSSH
ncbi:hypothetical protein PS652_02879 [Pseudomonas fluorescens]|uniref:Putrescine-binding periplasmic protein SpuD n=1 Tax=Pseudomonas fluorescens TaxID=294 RepID=A0A5E6VVC5_PSEFL|nr:hypothetical protein PS652_04236 [Pseudomonas fluorescens]